MSTTESQNQAAADPVSAPAPAHGKSEPTKSEIAKFRARFETLRVQAGFHSDAAVEQDMRWGRGLLNKILQGSRRLTHRTLTQLCKPLKCTDRALVEGTCYAYLLTTPPPSEAADDRSDLEARAERAQIERDAAFEAMAELQRQLREANARIVQLEQVETENMQVAAQLAHTSVILRQTEEARVGASQQSQLLQNQVSEYRRHLDSWVSFGREQERQVANLGNYAAHLENRVRGLQLQVADLSGRLQISAAANVAQLGLNVWLASRD